MKDRSISIRNVYIMMAYAFKGEPLSSSDPIGHERFVHLHDLLAAILSSAVAKQIKRGIHHDYQRRTEELLTVRGRINVDRSIGTRLRSQRLVCEFDEYTVDTRHNRAIKATLVLLLRHGEVSSKWKKGIRRLLPYFNEVTLVAPQTISWKDLSLHRGNASYRLLLGVCELVVLGLLPAEAHGPTKLSGWLNDRKMHNLYEAFILQYYRVHHSDLHPDRPHLRWDFDQVTALGAKHLPVMRTDISLIKDGRRLIIDAKYYEQSLQKGEYGKESIHSSHLYQVFAYAKNADENQDGSVSALLLYAHTDSESHPNLDVTIQGNRIGARTLDLNRPWTELQQQLDNAVSWLDPHS